MLYFSIYAHTATATTNSANEPVSNGVSKPVVGAPDTNSKNGTVKQDAIVNGPNSKCIDVYDM